MVCGICYVVSAMWYVVWYGMVGHCGVHEDWHVLRVYLIKNSIDSIRISWNSLQVFMILGTDHLDLSNVCS